jgi:hypothetical protein
MSDEIEPVDHLLAEITKLWGVIHDQQLKLAEQREWIGLTQQDIDIAFDDTQEGGGFDDFARAIEQCLKRKNT